MHSPGLRLESCHCKQDRCQGPVPDNGADPCHGGGTPKGRVNWHWARSQKAARRAEASGRGGSLFWEVLATDALSPLPLLEPWPAAATRPQAEDLVCDVSSYKCPTAYQKWTTSILGLGGPLHESLFKANNHTWMVGRSEGIVGIYSKETRRWGTWWVHERKPNVH